MSEFHPPRHGLRSTALACGGIFTAIALLSYCSFDLHVLLVLGSFGSSSVILFAFPHSHFAQPQSVVGGHVISSAIGLLVLALCGATWWSLALAVALSAAAMMASRTVHPPAGSNPIIVFLAAPGTLGWQFLLFPTLLGTIALVATGLLYHRASGSAYPLYWRAGKPATPQDAAGEEEERQAA